MQRERNEWMQSLDAQFEARHRVELPGGMVEFREVRPDWERSASPIVVAPGWGTMAETYHEFVLGIAKEGWRSYIIESPHGIDTDEIRGNELDAELRKAAALLGLLEHENIRSAHMVAHSEGGIWSLMAANVTDRIRDVVLMNPAGLLPKDTTKRLVGAYSREFFRQGLRGLHDPEVRERMLHTFPRGKREVARQPRQSALEVKAIAAANVREMVKEFRKKGGRVSLLLTASDGLFPPKKILEGLEAKDFDAIASFVKSQAGHGAPALDASLFAKAVSQQVEQLERLPRQSQ